MAGERQEIIDELMLAFADELSDAVKLVTITNYVKDGFDPITGDVGQTIENQAFGVKGIFLSHWEYEVFNSPVEPEDRGLLLMQDDFAFRPVIGTEISYDTEVSRVVEIRQDPMNVTWELRIRY